VTAPQVGDRVELEVGPVAAGGHCVARWADGRVAFVRHTLPGERVVAEVTSLGPGGRFVRADAVEVLLASPDRRPAPCPHAGPGGCGGCDWQHVEPQARRLLSAAVVSEAMRRQGGVEVGVEVEPVAGDRDGLGWRTRVTYAVDAQGRPGLRRHRSHDVVPVERCLLVTDAVDATGVTRRTWPGATTVSVTASSGGDVAVTTDPPGLAPAGRTRLTEVVDGRTHVVTPDCFWQVHPGAPAALTRAVVEALEPRAGDHALDLYAGAGLFAVALADALGPGGRVDAVESHAPACAAARRTVHDLPTVRVHEQQVERWLATSAPRRCDLVVLDPPESGAGERVLERLVRLGPRRVAYVSCGPASLGRDVRLMAGLGWRLDLLRAFDLFPMTHHVECLAVFRPA